MTTAFERVNARRLELARRQGREIRSRQDWQRQGRHVKPGQLQRVLRIYVGRRPIKDRKTGQKKLVPAWAHVFGFTAEQVY